MDVRLTKVIQKAVDNVSNIYSEKDIVDNVNATDEPTENEDESTNKAAEATIEPASAVVAPPLSSGLRRHSSEAAAALDSEEGPMSVMGTISAPELGVIVA